MHELSVTQSILEIALRYAHQQSDDSQSDDQQGARITDLYLVVGDLSSIIDDSVQFYWDIISRGTLAEGAQLHFERIPTQMQCGDCGHSYPPNAEMLACPACNSTQVQVIAGDEFRLDAIEIETGS